MVRPWVTQFVSYLSTVDLSSPQRKMVMIQHLEGPPLPLVEVVINQGPVQHALDQLLNYLKLSAASVLRKLFYLKQRPWETISQFVLKFRSDAINLGVLEERLKEAFIEALSRSGNSRPRSYWHPSQPWTVLSSSEGCMRLQDQHQLMVGQWTWGMLG